MKSGILTVLMCAFLFTTPAHAAEVPQALEPQIEVRSTSEILHRRQVMLSGMWAFASLNYLYADVIGFMDAEMHAAYETGEVNGLRLSDGFLTGATLFMQVPLSMVVLSTALKPKHARVANVVAGSFMTIMQGTTLFVGKPKGYYLAASILEMGATSFIAVYALLKLKPPKVVPTVQAYDGRPMIGISGRFR